MDIPTPTDVHSLKLNHRTNRERLRPSLGCFRRMLLGIALLYYLCSRRASSTGAQRTYQFEKRFEEWSSISRIVKMNVMIPMAGLGSRFADQGYRYPKPFINIVGRPMLFWLLDNLEFHSSDTVWVGIMKHLGEEWSVEARLRQEYPSLKLRFVTMDFQTRGAAETLFVMLQHMSPTELRRKSISLDCDTFYFSDILGDFRSCAQDCGCSFYFQDEGDKPIFSYLAFAPGTSKIVDIQEKVAISRHANTGAYGFPCGERLRDACQTVLDNPVGRAGEFYTSAVIAEMLRSGQEYEGGMSFRGIELDFASTSTAFFLPLRPHHKGLAHDHIVFSQWKTMCACSRCYLPLSAPAISQELKAAGHFIVIETCRTESRPLDCASEPSVPAEGSLTLRALREMGIFYDQIVFGKSPNDVCVNTLNDHACQDVEKEVGWCLKGSDTEGATRGSRANFMIARPFNRIICLDDKYVVKSAPLEYLRGELHFYRSIPSQLSSMFPKLVEANYDPRTDLPSFTMTKVDGVSFSHLATNHCITRGRFAKLLHGLHHIHSTKASSARPDLTSEQCLGQVVPSADHERHPEYAVAPSAEPITRSSEAPDDLPSRILCANLHDKVKRRFHANRDAYEAFDEVDVSALSNHILSYLRGYEENRRFRWADFIHGDPVFSNCLLDKENSVIFVDMRGSLGDVVCTGGDVNYDLSKVYQSLCGYDFFILDKELTAGACTFLRDLEENVFWPFVRENYPDVLPRDIAVLAASHFLSIVPLHEHRRHRGEFLSACAKILARKQC